MLDLWKRFHPTRPPPKTPPGAHRGEAPQVQRLSEAIQFHQQPENSYAASQVCSIFEL